MISVQSSRFSDGLKIELAEGFENIASTIEDEHCSFCKSCVTTCEFYNAKRDLRGASDYLYKLATHK